MINKILVITPVKHISGVSQTLKSIGEVTFLDDPLLKANADYMEHAIEMLHEKRFWQIGRESVAIGKVADSPTIIYEEEDDHEKSIH